MDHDDDFEHDDESEEHEENTPRDDEQGDERDDVSDENIRNFSLSPLLGQVLTDSLDFSNLFPSSAIDVFLENQRKINARIAEIFSSSMADSFNDIASSGILKIEASTLLPGFTEVLKPITDRFHKNLFEPFAGLFEKIKAYTLAEVLKKSYWWPVPGLPDDFYFDLIELGEEGKSRQINRFFCDWFKWSRYRRLGRMVYRWEHNQYFASRKHIYKQALIAHRKGLYNTTIPTLLPLIEGISEEFLNDQMISSERMGVRATIEEALRQMNIPDGVFEASIKTTMLQFLTDSTYASTDTEDSQVLPSGYELNRHGILHGVHKKYGSEANSLRCFLWLETIYHYLEDDRIPVEWDYS